jgi:hypothetical protein
MQIADFSPSPSIDAHLCPATDYPPPPRVHWLALLFVWMTLSILVHVYIPAPWQALLDSLIPNAWAFYLCRWIGKLDSNARSPFWCDVYLVVELSCAALNVHPLHSQSGQWLVTILQIASPILAIATIYLIRADLLRHYREREPRAIELGPILTFFFSFLYFQSELYPIAIEKQREALYDSSGA